MEALTAILLFIAGVIIGTLAAMFGIGGAILAIPLFRILLGFSGSEAIATALPLTIPTTLAGTYHFSKHNLVKYRTAIVGGVTGIIFSIGGAYATQFFSGEALMFGVGALVLLLAILILKTKTQDERYNDNTKLGKKLIITAFIGGFAGFLSGFFGIGGGAFIVPLLIAFRKINIKKAIPTSLAMIAIFALPGALTHYILGNINILVLGIVFFGVVIGTKMGANTAIKMDQNIQKKMLAGLLIIIGIMLIFHEISLK